jgi:hypothetical protein
MANPQDVKDPGLRASLGQAGRLLDDGDYLGAVRLSVDAYAQLAERRPDVIVRPPMPGQPASASGGTPGTRARAWPSYLGVSVDWEGDKPSLKFDKERFGMSEAASIAVHRRRNHPAPGLAAPACLERRPSGRHAGGNTSWTRTNRRQDHPQEA